MTGTAPSWRTRVADLFGWVCWLLDMIPSPYIEDRRFRFAMSGIGCRLGVYKWARRRLEGEL